MMAPARTFIWGWDPRPDLSQGEGGPKDSQGEIFHSLVAQHAAAGCSSFSFRKFKLLNFLLFFLFYPMICWRQSTQSSGVGILDQTSAKERVGGPKDSQREIVNCLVAQHPAADRQLAGSRWFLLICLFPGPACQPSLW